MTESPESNTTNSQVSGGPVIRELPNRFVWQFCRYLARFAGSVFFPYFRVWGETDQRTGGQIFITRNYGIQTWLSALRVFKRPVRVVMADASADSRWLKLAKRLGLAPIAADGSPTQNFLAVEHLAKAGENLLLVVPQTPSPETESLVANLRAIRSIQVMFMAVSGCSEALPAAAFVPRVVPVSVFCGLPHYLGNPLSSPFAELEFLEQALKDLEIDELPSIFLNHPRNLSRSRAV